MGCRALLFTLFSSKTGGGSHVIPFPELHETRRFSDPAEAGCKPWTPPIGALECKTREGQGVSDATVGIKLRVDILSPPV